RVTRTPWATSTLLLFKNGTCAGAAAAPGSSASLASPGIAVGVNANTTTLISATATYAAGNVSACSNAISYVHDDIAPTVTLTATSPASPSPNATPSVIGTASESGTVQFFRNDPTCAGAVAAATGTTAALASPGISVTVPLNATTTISARAIDAAGNTGPCSNALSYVNDTIAPSAVITTTSPASPSSSLTPILIGTSNDPNATIAAFT